MNIWEIVILIIVGSICVFGGIGAVYSSIVKTVEGYQIRKAKRAMQVYLEVTDELANVFIKSYNSIKEKMNEEEKKRTAELKEYMEKIKTAVKDIDE